ncbi:MAG: protein kinase [Candidatus Nitronauta litoralis]|uniref:Protein kinase n=1 Tax=Candidatus Nitronauta litoralis TaxID=2705533 RepID=A0A7T0BT29_9BACT|nr:MAG: protein kinase [Candidatus Nitronauta litoralis]
MSQILDTKRELIAQTSGLTCKVKRLLGSGGQGEVYEARLNNQPVALKWYHPQVATSQQRKALEMLVAKGPPDRSFLWPLDIVTTPDLPHYGYLMPLRDPRYQGIADLMKGRIDPTFRILATAGMNLASSFLQLHARGMCYRDIAFGNVFFDADTGEVLICDNDNVSVDHEEKGSVLGTPRFMAPEVVRGEAWPSTQTDLFSLSVLLFYMFMVHHPLEGKREVEIKCLDLPAMTRLYGENPVFIFDPENKTNRPHKEFQKNPLAFWPVYPEFLRKLFVRAFTEGLHDPSRRVRESEWRNTLIRLRDSILYCADCGTENVYDRESLGEGAQSSGACWSCQKPIPLPPRIRIEKSIIMLNHDTHVFPHHVDDQKLYDFSLPVAEVNQHPDKPGIWGLKNISRDKWVMTTPQDETLDVPPHKTVPLLNGTRIHFGNKQGEIRS